MSRIYYILIIVVSVTLLVANQSNPPNGRTGAPGEGSCSDCHTLNGQNQDGNIVITGFPATIVPSMAYVITVTVDNPNGNADLAGFQVTILNASNQKAGNMSAPSPTSTVTPSGSRQYWEHNPAQQYPSNNMVSWSVTWVAPTGPPNTTITAYAAGNVAKDNNNDSNDLIVFSTSAGTLQGGADPLQVDIISHNDVLCNGGNNGSATAGASNGTPPYTYNWSNGTNMATNNNLSAGLYFVTVTDMISSTATTSIVISQPPVLNLQPPVINPVSCFGGQNGSIQAAATGGTSPFSFSWSNGSSGSFISGLAAGNYSVTVTDDHACTKSATYQVNQPAAIDIELESLTHETCLGEEDGAIMISTSGGTGALVAEWSNGLNGNVISNLSPDSYIVTVSDNNNCTQSASFTVNAGSNVTVALEDLQHVTCHGGNNGFIAVLGTGGTAPYQYTWSNGASESSVSNLTSGSYSVTITDLHNCMAVKSYTITQPGAITIQFNASGMNLCSMDSLVDLTAIPGSGAQQPVTAIWSNGTQGLNNNDLAAGLYTITITDFGGCTASASQAVTAPSELEVLVLTLAESSAGAHDGTAEVLVSGGTAGYTFLWSNGSTTDSISGLAPGPYSVTVTDLHNCSSIGTGHVDAGNCQLMITPMISDVICHGDSSGSITVGIANATPPIQYLWDTGDTTATIDHLPAGSYTVTVVDNGLCSFVQLIPIAEPELLVFSIDSVTNITDSSSGSIGITPDGGIEPYTYLWTYPNGSVSFDQDLDSLADAGSYTLTVTDANGCETSATVMVDMDVAVDPAQEFKRIKVYPVPASDILYLDLEREVKEVLIMGIDGRMHKRIVNPVTNHLQVGDLDAGWYILRISDGTSWYIARMVK